MSKIQVSVPKGTRDFGPEVMRKRNYIFGVIAAVYEKFGYQPLETPSMELLSTLTGKYGEEGDKLIFKILNNGAYLSKLSPEDLASLKERGEKFLTSKISEKALRYDLTVPFARFVVQHRNDIVFPFKRYQIQPVWRADNPQRGRYREFYQCDADVVGSPSLLYEAELVQIFDEVLDTLGLPGFSIKINNRKILGGLAEVLGIEDRFASFLIGLDKLDKIGEDGVRKELTERGFEEGTIHKAFEILLDPAAAPQKLDELQAFFSGNATGSKGVEELRFIWTALESAPLRKATLELDLSLARGLDYYTGAIFEVKAHGVQMGSICGGGRYDNLTGIFGLEGVSGVGISFGADRIYDVMEELKLFPQALSRSSDLLITNFGEKEALHGLQLAQELRAAGIKTEIYPEAGKLKKQFEYATKKGIPYLLMLGENEVNTGIYGLKNQLSGEQINGNIQQIISEIKK
ncbi:MAG: histidine--tRNA ligase [Bacteroidia bacterium]|nr:histidine--tRNA ligase [Bacteroidia bacterium]